MKLKALFEDDGAVSPVIGVILMVAITVILAAVIGTFVLGLGDRVSEAQPTASFGFENPSSSTVEVTHDGGDAIVAKQLSFKGAGAGGTTWADEGSLSPNDDVTAGDSVTVDSLTSGETLRLVWSASSSDKTATLGKYEVES
jgi:flagellin-like protein